MAAVAMARSNPHANDNIRPAPQAQDAVRFLLGGAKRGGGVVSKRSCGRRRVARPKKHTPCARARGAVWPRVACARCHVLQMAVQLVAA